MGLYAMNILLILLIGAALKYIDDRFGLSDVISGIFGVIFLIALTMSLANSIGVENTIGLGILAIGPVTAVALFVKHKKRKKELTCSHGIYRGRECIDGIFRCPQCQKEKETHEEAQRVLEEQKRLIEEQKKKTDEYTKQYQTMRSLAIQKYRDSIQADKQTLGNMTPVAFETYVVKLFVRMGYTSVKQTPPSNDGGKDFTYINNNGIYYGECKHYKDKKVGRPEIQKLAGAMAAGHAKGGVFVTTSTFTEQARNEAARLLIETIDGDRLIELINQYSTDDDKLQDYKLICTKCGKIVSFSYLDSKELSKLCPDGHEVASAFQRMYQSKPKKAYQKHGRMYYL